jgi:septal ring factor EnvC (AmiA/AmiB activator)
MALVSGGVEDVLASISAAVSAAGDDVDEIERRLTDGYAHALALEAQRSRLERTLLAAVQELVRSGNAAKAKTEELSALAASLDGTVGELTRLRGALGELRRHASSVRAAAVA